MSLPVTDRTFTVEELYAMPEDGLKHELQAGMLVSEPLPGFRHGWVATNIGTLLREHVRRNGQGVVIIHDTAFVLARDPDTVRGPDVAFVSSGRLAALADPVKAFPGAPDLAVEVRSPSETPVSLHAKVADYLAAGTRLVWIVDPERESVTVYRSLLSPRVLTRDHDLDGEDVVPGFRAAVAEIFET